MKVYDICLHIGNGGEWLGDFYLKIKQQLEFKDISVLLYTDVSEVKSFFDKKNVTDYIFLDKYLGDINITWAMSFVTQLGFNPRRLYNTEQTFYSIKEKDCIEYFSRMIHAISLLKVQPKARYYITYEGDELDHNIFRIIGRINNGQFIYWGISNLNTRIHFHNDEKRYFNTPAEDISSIPDLEIKWIKDYIKDYTQKKTNLWGDPARDDIKFKLSYIKIALKKIIQAIKGKSNDPRRTFNHAFIRYIKRLIRRQYAYLKYTNNFTFSENINYYYFPLHVPFDSQLTQRGLPFYDQVSLIQTISKYLPFDSKLIVKEHPMGRGYYSISDIKKLGDLPNVILLPANANSHDLVPKAKAIFVINSSVGYEALMYKKTVITFGRSFYREQGLTVDIDSLYDLETVFEKTENHKISEDDVLKFIYRVKKNTYPIDLYNINEENYLSKVEAFSEALSKEYFKALDGNS